MGRNMSKKICLFGHRKILVKIQQLKDNLKLEIEKWVNNGFKTVLIGTHGQFDALVLSVCNELKKIYLDLKIYVVFTSMASLKKDKNGFSNIDCFKFVNTCLYPVEEEHFKRKITASNKMMVDESDIVICYVNPQIKRSGARTAMNYAIKRNRVVINLYDENLELLYGKSKEQLDIEFKKYLNYMKEILNN